ncbi:MAG: hypothetical protein K6B54_06195 [Clostridia bacterium]|nr:hypothetical protein [Clostridia bacterium]
MSGSGTFRKYLSAVLALLLFISAQAVPASYAKSAPSVDPETKRVNSYVGTPKVGLWLDKFDDAGNCIGDVYAVFNAGASFNQFGFPRIWAGKSSDLTDAEYTTSIYAFDETPEKSIQGEPLFSETLHQDSDNGYGAIFPMEKTLPAGKYVLYVKQITKKTSDAKPYIVLPTGTASKTDDCITFGGTAASGPLCFFVDFIKDANVIDYFLPLSGTSGTTIVTDDPVTVFSPPTTDAQRLDDGDTFAILTDQIPDGKILFSITFSSMPTWSNNGPGSSVSYEVYKWNTSYVYTTSREPVFTGEVLDHKDNAPLELNFGYSLAGGTRYLIVMRKSGNMAIGFWVGAGEIAVPKWRVYKNGRSIDNEPLPGFSYTTATIEEYDFPDETPTSEPANTPDTSSPSQSTSDEETAKPANKGCSGTVAWPVLVITALPFLFLTKTKKKPPM